LSRKGGGNGNNDSIFSTVHGLVNQLSQRVRSERV
jgi:hypothetical protein